MQVAPTNSAPNAGFMGSPMLLLFDGLLLQIIPALRSLLTTLAGALHDLLKHCLALEVLLGKPTGSCCRAKPLARQGFTPLLTLHLGFLKRSARSARLFVCLVKIARALLRSRQRCHEQKKNKH
jgi:hypothetical protein